MSKCKTENCSREISERSKSGLCRRCQHRTWEKPSSEDRRRWALKHYYNLTPEEWQRMFNEQGGVCKICKKPEWSTFHKLKVKRLAIDHDKGTGRIRGLLCEQCNTGLGKLKHDISIIDAAIDYLNKSEVTDA